MYQPYFDKNALEKSWSLEVEICLEGPNDLFRNEKELRAFDIILAKPKRKVAWTSKQDIRYRRECVLSSTWFKGKNRCDFGSHNTRQKRYVCFLI